MVTLIVAAVVTVLGYGFARSASPATVTTLHRVSNLAGVMSYVLSAFATGWGGERPLGSPGFSGKQNNTPSGKYAGRTIPTADLPPRHDGVPGYVSGSGTAVYQVLNDLDVMP